MFAGKKVPIGYVPLLREDALGRSNFQFTVGTTELAERLMNGVQIKTQAWFVSKLVLSRFLGSAETLNRAYMEQQEPDGTAIPWFVSTAAGPNGPNTWVYNNNECLFYKTLGLHIATGQTINSDLMESYEKIVNYERQQRSQHLPEYIGDVHQTNPNTYFANCFWQNSQMKHVKPDFDDAMMEGSVPVSLTEGADIPVVGVGVQTGTVLDPTPPAVFESNSTGDPVVYDNSASHGANGNGANLLTVDMYPSGVPKIRAELQAAGLEISLANIELARKSQAWARVRNRYQGIDDDDMVNLLMDGIRIPEASQKTPMLLDSQRALFGMNQRFATDGENLDLSASNGGATTRHTIQLPQAPFGGVVMFTAEIVPEQLYERQKDYYVSAAVVEELPAYTRDELDVQKVQIRRNDGIDVLHSDPGGVFGYEPLNAHWMRRAPRIGGKYTRPDDDAFKEDRQKIWSAEMVDPELGEEWYLATGLHHKVFADQNTDPFEVMFNGRANIVGNTVLGPALIEASDDYDKVIAEADTTRIEPVPPAATSDDEKVEAQPVEEPAAKE